MSLIEVVAVIALLLFGILSVVKIFSSGFFVLHNAGNLNRAERMDTALLEDLHSTSSVPDAVYVTYPGLVSTLFDPTIDPVTTADLSPLSSPTGYLDSQDINKARNISNEPVTIPTTTTVTQLVAGVPVPTTYPPTYVARFGPIVFNSTDRNALLTGDPTTLDPTHLSVISSPWTNLAGSEVIHPAVTGPPAPAPNEGEFYSDTTSDNSVPTPGIGYLLFPARPYTQYFYVTFTDVGGLKNPPYLLILPPTTYPWIPSTGASYTGDWLSGAQMMTLGYFGGFQNVPANWSAISVVRAYRVVSSSAAFSSDPYEFTMPVTTTGPGSPFINTQIPGTDANYGVLQFNPAAGGTGLNKPLKALISYTVYDWHILHEDHSVAANNGAAPPVELNIGNLKVPGVVQYDQSIYRSVVDGSTTEYPIFMLDLDTGVPINTSIANTYNSATTAANPALFGIDYSGGVITPPTAFASRHVRIYYQNTSDMALALEKTTSVLQYANGGVGEMLSQQPAMAVNMTSVLAPQSVPGLSFYIESGLNLTAGADWILLPPAFAGKNLQVQNITFKDTSALPHTISERFTVPVSATTVPDTAASGQSVCYADLTPITNSFATAHGFAYNPGNDSLTVGQVGGDTATAFCIWHENGKWKTHTTNTVQ